jgi:hypothetical protein
MPTWRKSSYSSTEGGNCVEIACDQPNVLIRDSKNPDGPVLAVTQWEAFLRLVHGV